MVDKTDQENFDKVVKEILKKSFEVIFPSLINITVIEFPLLAFLTAVLNFPITSCRRLSFLVAKCHVKNVNKSKITNYPFIYY